MPPGKSRAPESAPALQSPDPLVVDQVLDWLVEHDLQSDQRYAEALVRQSGARQGRQRIVARLRAAGVSSDVVSVELGELADTELERAYALWRHRFGEWSADGRIRARQTRFLINRGFSSETVGRVMRMARQNKDAE